MSALRFALNLVFSIEELFIGVCLFFAILLEVVGVFFRDVLQRPFAWSEEFLTFLLVWMVFIGCSIAVRRGEHVYVDVLVKRFPPHIGTVVAGFTSIAFALFIALLGWTGLQTVLLQIRSGELSPVMEMPMWLISLAVPVGCFLMLLSLIARPRHDPSPMESMDSE